MKNKKSIYVCMLIIVIIFGIIASQTPISGDDWFYINFFKEGNFITRMINRYFTTQPRLLAWLTTTIFAGNRFLWVLLVPFLFALIFFVINKIVDIKSNNYIVIAVLFLGIFLVPKEMKVSTFFWLSGTFYYAYPLALSLIYHNLLFKIVFDNKKVNGLLLLFFSIYLGLHQVNVIISLIVGMITLLIYDFYKNRRVNYSIVLGLIGSIIVTLFSYYCPGTKLRLEESFYFYTQFSMWEKFEYSYPVLLQVTFKSLLFPILIYSSCMIYFGIRKVINKQYNFFNISITLINVGLLGFVSLLLINQLFGIEIKYFTYYAQRMLVIHDVISIKSFILTLFAINMIVSPILIENEEKAFKAFYFILIGAAGCFVLVMSHIIGSRAMIFTYIYILISAGIALNEIKFKKVYRILVIIIASTLLINSLYKWYISFENVVRVNYARKKSLELFELDKVDRLYFPIYSTDVHGGDISHIYGEKHFIQYCKANNFDNDIKIKLLTWNEYLKWKEGIRDEED